MTERLLVIDVDAEIRKLAEKRFKTPADYAIEILRWAASRKPLRVDVEISRARFAVRSDDAVVPVETVGALSVMLDGDRSAEERHEALVSVEGSAPGLLAAFSPRGAVVRIASAQGGRTVVHELSLGRGARRVEPRPEERPGVEVRGAGRVPALERTALAEAARYSIAPIFVDGARVNRGFVLADAVVQIDLRNERLRGVVGLPLKSDLVRVVRLEHQIRSEEKLLSSVGGMILHAVVDESDPDFEATMGTLRRAGRRLYARLAEMYEELGGDRRVRAFDLLVERFEHTHEAHLLDGVRAFATAAGGAVDLAGVRELASKGSLRAIALEEPLRKYDLSEDRAVLRLSARQRRFLEKELNVRLESPPVRSEDRGFCARLVAARRSLLARFGAGLGGRRGRPLEDSELLPEESAFLEAVRAEIRSGAFALPNETRPFGLVVRMAEGQRRPFVRTAVRGAGNEYSVSRDHPLVQSMVGACASDRGFLYPALCALARGHDGYAENRAAARRQAT